MVEARGLELPLCPVHPVRSCARAAARCLPRIVCHGRRPNCFRWFKCPSAILAGVSYQQSHGLPVVRVIGATGPCLFLLTAWHARRMNSMCPCDEASTELLRRSPCCQTSTRWPSVFHVPGQLRQHPSICLRSCLLPSDAVQLAEALRRSTVAADWVSDHAARWQKGGCHEVVVETFVLVGSQLMSKRPRK